MALTLCVWVGVLSTLLPIRIIVELNFASIYIFSMSRIHLELSFKSIFNENVISHFPRYLMWRFQTTFSGSSWCPFKLKITQNSTSLINSKWIFRLLFDPQYKSEQFWENLCLSLSKRKWEGGAKHSRAFFHNGDLTQGRFCFWSGQLFLVHLAGSLDSPILGKRRPYERSPLWKNARECFAPPSHLRLES